MIIFHLDVRDNRLREMSLPAGSNLRGLRIVAIEFQGPDEFVELLSEEGKNWVKTHIIPAFATKEIRDYFNKGKKPS